ncbi:hypothetical protein D3C73_1150500 [compost metagenome]
MLNRTPYQTLVMQRGQRFPAPQAQEAGTFGEADPGGVKRHPQALVGIPQRIAIKIIPLGQFRERMRRQVRRCYRQRRQLAAMGQAQPAVFRPDHALDGCFPAQRIHRSGSRDGTRAQMGHVPLAGLCLHQ